MGWIGLDIFLGVDGHTEMQIICLQFVSFV